MTDTSIPGEPRPSGPTDVLDVPDSMSSVFRASSGREGLDESGRRGVNRVGTPPPERHRLSKVNGSLAPNWSTPMITLRLASCTVLVAALAAGCASAPAAPVTSGHSPEPANSAQASNTGPTDAARPTAVASAASPSAPPATSTTAAAVRLEGNGALAAGRYYLDDRYRYYTNANRLTFTVPAGWTTDDGELYKDRDEPGAVKFTTWVLTHVFSDVCQWGTLVDAGTTVDEFVNAVMEQEGREASAPTAVTVGGFPAKRLELTVPAEIDTETCTNRVVRYWPGPGPDLSDGYCCHSPGSTDSVYVVDVAGNRLVAIARHEAGSSAENRAELQALVDSIEIEP